MQDAAWGDVRSRCFERLSVGVLVHLERVLEHVAAPELFAELGQHLPPAGR